MGKVNEMVAERVSNRMSGDPHTHLEGHDARGHTPQLLIQAAKNEDLDFVAVTNHDSAHLVEETMALGEKEGMIVIPGFELNTAGILSAEHITVLGVTPKDFNKYRKYMVRQTIEAASEVAHGLGGIVIAAHPKPTGRIFSLSYERVKNLALRRVIDGVEATIDGVLDPQIVTIAERFGILAIGSSDAHRFQDVATGITELPFQVDSWQKIIETLRSKRVTTRALQHKAAQSMGLFHSIRKHTINRFT